MERTTGMDIAHMRLHTQHLAGAPLQRPEDVVRWLDAVQAQDYQAALWALSLRLGNAGHSDLEQAFTDGTILRTHVMRPTWHFVAPDDIRWLLALTAPRVRAFLAHYDRKLGLDAATLARSSAAMQKALAGGKQLTRVELAAILQQERINTEGTQRLAHLMMHAELEGILCSGARRGKQFTYALLEERAPKVRTLGRGESLAELTRRYFTGHGPATLKDFVWWSGLTSSDVKAGLEMVKSELEQVVIDGIIYWFAKGAPFVQDAAPTAYLLPNFDEYSVGYKDRSAILEAARTQNLELDASTQLGYVIVIDGQIRGTWKRTSGRGEVVIAAQTFTKLTDAEYHSIRVAADCYGAFLGMPAVLQVI